MQFTSLGGSDAMLIHLHVHSDSRGEFARVWCSTMFESAGLKFNPVQGNSSVTRRKGSVRGMHFQRFPYADPKIVRCSSGRIHDVVVDLREDSPHRGRVFHCELGCNETMLFIPAGFAHGFQALTDEVLVEYLMGVEYRADYYDGARYDDPLLSIDWPEDVVDLSEKDRSWPDLAERMPWLVKEGARC